MRGVVGAAVGLAFAASVGAQPAPIPPAATPGGAQPFRARPDLTTEVLGEVFAVPPLAERPLGLDEGPRVKVRAWHLASPLSRRTYGVMLNDVQAMMDAHLATQPPEGFTVNQMQAFADEIALYYRSRGLFLTQAFVPAQEVRDGVVVIQLLEGQLGSVAVEGNTIYDADTVELPFMGLVGAPIREDQIEEALLTLQEFPGLTVFGTFREGANLGETELLVQVREEDRATYTPIVDNYGSEYTGKGRFMLDIDVNNPFGAADRIAAYVLKTWDPANGVYGGIDYLTTIGERAQSRIGGGFARNTFDVSDPTAGNDLGLHGIVEQADVRWQRSFAQSRTYRGGGALALAYKEAVTEQPGDDPIDELYSLSYTYDFFSVSSRRRGMNVGYVRAIAGDNRGERVSRRGGSGATSAGSFSKLDFSYQRLQRFSPNHALLMRLEGQASNELLASLEQYSIGGPANVRAYPVSEALIDTGGAATVEWIIDAPGFAKRPLGTRTWGDVFQVSVYADWAGGEVNDPFPFQDDTVNLRGYGLGLQLALPNRFSLRVDVATPDSGVEPSNGRDPQTYVGFNVTF
ncbi:MAG TPA: ShlB/FhaC/HecB family hemolysin secretion/activation protein [Gammaproteobacteria bacterium]